MLKNMAVLVTGAAGSLGSATSKKLISEGCKVALFDLPSTKGVEVAQKLGQNAIFCPGDVTSDEDVLSALETIKKNFGELRAVVNCAGVHRSFCVYNFQKQSPGAMDKINETLNVNVSGTINVIRLALGYMHENTVDKNDLRGVIINTSGFAAFDGQSGQVALSCAWGAISSMTMTLCRELGNEGFRVMTIAPGIMESNLTDGFPSKLIRSFSVLTPSPKRFGYKEEYADLVITILKNNFLNGEVIRLDGGLRLNI